MKNLGKAVLLAGLVAVASGCSSSSDSASPTGPNLAALEAAVADATAAVAAIEASTPVGVYDGAATGCTVMTAEAANTATEDATSAGVYTFANTIADNTVVTATGCTDSDTGLQLAPMKGVVVNQAVLVTPIASLVVEAALVAGAATVAPGDLVTATAAINTALGLDSTFDATNPETGNYASDVTTNATSQTVQEAAFMVSVVMKMAEKTDPTALSQIAKNIAASSPTILTVDNLTNVLPGSVAPTAIQTVLTKVDAATSTALMGAVVKAAAVTLNDSTVSATDAATAVTAIDLATLTPITLVDAVDAVAAKAAALAAAQEALAAAQAALDLATGATGATGAS